MEIPVRRLATVLAVASLLVAGCGDDDDVTSSSSTSAATSAESTSSTTAGTDEEEAATTSTTAPVDEGAVIEIAVVGGQVEGGGRHEVPLGEEVVLRVTSDTADEVHVHGYDLYLDLAAGEPAELRFTADIPGVFEAELHDSGIVLAELQIR